MEIKLTNLAFFLRAKCMLFIMKTFILLFATTVFSFSTYSTFSQEKVIIEYDQEITVDEVFKIIKQQTSLRFIYEKNMFKSAPKVTLKQGEISVVDLLEKTLKSSNVEFNLTNNKTIVIKAGEPKVQLNENQEIIISGKVTDENGVPLPEVNIVNEMSKGGATTNFDGLYSIKANKGDILTFSYVGYFPQKIRVEDVNVINVILLVDVNVLDDVVVLGYQTTTKRESTGSVSKIKGEDVAIQPVPNPILALQGRAAGVTILNPSGSVGAMPEVQIRGVGTLTGQNQPLYILDGVIIPNQSQVQSQALIGNYLGIQGVSPFNSINPQDIESIEVLKDADATAIYGSRGSNGVIVITTKKGKQGDVKFNFDFSTGVTSAAEVPKRLNTQQYLQLRRDAFAIGNYDPNTEQAINPISPTEGNAPDLLNPLWLENAYTDWADFELGNTAVSKNFQASASGGTKALNFYSSLGYNRNEDITRGDPYQQRLSGLVNLSHTSANDRFNLSFSNSLAQDVLRPSQGSVANQSRLSALPPNMPSFYPDGSEYWPEASIAASNIRNFLTNPFAGDYVDQQSTTFSVISNINTSYKIFDNLIAKVQVGYNNQKIDFFNKRTSRSIDPFGNPQEPSRTESQNVFETINIEPQLNYFTDIGKGKLDVLLGTTFFQRNNDIYNIRLEGFESDLLMDSWSAATNVTQRSSSALRYNFNSVFGRVGYNWDNKYIVNASLRRDGSSRFGPNKKWGNFASIGAAWVFTEEPFLENNTVLSFGKLRGSYGTTGNDQIADFRYTSLFGAGGLYDNLPVLSPTFLANPNFQWETTTKRDIALELGFFSNRILLNVNWFRNLSTDLLTDQAIPSQTGFSSFLANFAGVIENKGWEIELVTNNLNPTSEFNWKTFFNISFLDNSLLEYPDLPNSPNANLLEIGRPVPNPRYPTNIERPWIFLNIDPATGQPVLADINEDGLISTGGFNDRQWYGSSIPSFQGGLTNSFSYKGFTLDVFFQFAKQYTTNHLYGSQLAGQLFNPVSDYAGNYWTQPGDISKYPRPFTGLNNNSTAQSRAVLSQYLQSSAAVEEVFYARLKNVSLAYSLPKNVTSSLNLDNLTVYVRGQNIFTYVNKDLFKDPEIIDATRGFIPFIVNYGVNLTF